MYYFYLYVAVFMSVSELAVKTNLDLGQPNQIQRILKKV